MDSTYTRGRSPLDELFWFVAGVRDAHTVALCGCVLLVCRPTRHWAFLMHGCNVHCPPIKVWELLLTFDQELEYFWCPPFAWSKALFFSVSSPQVWEVFSRKI